MYAGFNINIGIDDFITIRIYIVMHMNIDITPPRPLPPPRPRLRRPLHGVRWGDINIDVDLNMNINRSVIIITRDGHKTVHLAPHSPNWLNEKFISPARSPVF